MLLEAADFLIQRLSTSISAVSCVIVGTRIWTGLGGWFTWLHGRIRYQGVVAGSCGLCCTVLVSCVIVDVKVRAGLG